MTTPARHRTAIRRTALSRPVALALDDGLISTDTTFFDYGCGRGGDLLRLHRMGVPVAGWDPAFFPDEARTPADVVNLGYVVNVIEDVEERAAALCAAWNLAQKVLVVAARLDWEARTLQGDFHGDGIVTRRRTFQKLYAHEELRAWIKAISGRQPVAAAPGVFYVFREPADEQAYLAARITRQRTVPRVRFDAGDFERHADVLRPLMVFVAARGRFPVGRELPEAGRVAEVFGSVPRAFMLVRRVTGSEHWEAIRRARRDDLLVYVALAAFPKRPRFGELPDAMRADVRAFFGTWKAARAEGDRLLFAAGNQAAVDQACARAAVGKLTPEALYVHAAARDRLSPLLRVYEGCGRQLAGTVEGATLVKLARRRPAVSYLVYPDFDRTAHPALAESVIADLASLRLGRRDYRAADNPPILHRKELFVSEDDPRRAKFRRLTAQEERRGLLGPGTPGTRREWEALLQRAGVTCRGHRLATQPAAARCEPASHPK